MGKFIFGSIAGSLITAVLLTLFTGLLFSSAERQLIDKWRRVDAGMNRESVLKTLGEPAYEFKIGDGFPLWAENSVPKDYHQTHALLIFYVEGFGPQLLLVYFNSDGNVSFISSTHT